MPTRIENVSNNEIIVPVLVSAPRRPAEPTQYRGLVDTGARGTEVSPKVIADLEPVATGKTTLILADETLRESTTYLLDIGVIASVDASDGNGMAAAEIASGKKLHQVTTVPHRSNRYDLILGMDLLSMYHITMVDSQFVISIRQHPIGPSGPCRAPVFPAAQPMGNRRNRPDAPASWFAQRSPGPLPRRRENRWCSRFAKTQLRKCEG